MTFSDKQNAEKIKRDFKENFHDFVQNSLAKDLESFIEPTKDEAAKPLDELIKSGHIFSETELKAYNKCFLIDSFPNQSKFVEKYGTTKTLKFIKPIYVLEVDHKDISCYDEYVVSESKVNNGLVRIPPNTVKLICQDKKYLYLFSEIFTKDGEKYYKNCHTIWTKNQDLKDNNFKYLYQNLYNLLRIFPKCDMFYKNITREKEVADVLPNL